MMSNPAAPKPGVDYRVVLGDSMLESATSTTNSYAILRYDFKPASVDRTRQGTVQMRQDGRQIVYSLPTINSDEPDVNYQGRFDPGNELECVAIFDGKGGFRLERVLGQAYLRHTNMRTLKRDSASQPAAPQANGGSPPIESGQVYADRKINDGVADTEAFDAELEAELERGLFEDVEDQGTAASLPVVAEAAPEATAHNEVKQKSPEPVKPVPSEAPASPISQLDNGSSSSESSDSSSESDDDDNSPKAAVVPAWPAAAADARAEPMNELEREFLGIPAAPSQPEPVVEARQSSSSSSSDSSDSSSSDSSSSDSSDDEDIHRCSDDDSDGKDVEWF